MSCTWAEWKKWTAVDGEDDLIVLRDQLMDLTRSANVCEFIEYLLDYIQYCRVREVNRLFDDPRREFRTYHEALREIQSVLEDLRPKGRKRDGGRISIANIRGR